MNEEEQIRRGKEADRLLENPLLKEAFAAIRQRYRDEIEMSKPSEGKRREWSYVLLCAVKVVEGHLTSFANTGKLASVEKSEREEQEVRERELSEWDGSPDGHTEP
jgi:hypothetical protein